MADTGKSRSTKDKEMAARLKDAGDERWTGKCAICYKTITNGTPTFNHYAAHSRGANGDGGE